MRIVAGRLRGRPLVPPRDSAVRPTSDRVREAIFNIIAHNQYCPDLAEARVIDLFAGTGALGIEAVSRGAAFCLFVDDAAASRALIRENVEAMGLTGATRIFRRDATTLGPAGTMAPFRFAFMDPPYDKGLATLTLRELDAGRWLEDAACVAVEDRIGADLTVPPAFIRLDQRTWGDTNVHFLRYRLMT